MQIYNYKLHELLTHNAGLVIFYENEDIFLRIYWSFGIFFVPLRSKSKSLVAVVPTAFSSVENVRIRLPSLMA